MRRPSSIPLRVTAQQAAAFRLARHHLLSPDGNDPVAVCRDLCGVQAQLMPAAQMAIGARTQGLRSAAIASALWEKRTLVKSLCMRQTVHLIPADEFSLYLTAVRASRVAAVRRIMGRFGITDNDAEALNRATLEALERGPLPMRDLAGLVRPRVSKRVRAWMERVWNPARLALVEGLICYGPDCGPLVTFVRADQWLPRGKRLTEDVAQQFLLMNFLRAYGPATLRDFSHWSGIPAREARPVWERAAGELVEVSLDGARAWLLRRDLPELQDARLPGAVVRLLPAFDSYLLAHADKGHLVEPRYYKRVFRSLGQISPVVLVNGRIAGTWRHAPGKSAEMAVSVQLFTKPTKPLRRQIDEQAARHGKFLGRRARVEYHRA